ncbi:MAG: SAM-dependent methyltransferase, partial [Jannaschia sp.]
VAEAAKGRRVVRLKSGDPGVFGRATEELDAAHAAGIAVEIVPGVTAASAAGAAMGRSLTQRGRTDTLVLATATYCEGAHAPDWARHAVPGTSLVFYMGVRAAAGIAATLRARGVRDDTVVTIAADVSRDSQAIIGTTLRDFPAEIERQALTGNALIMLTLPSEAASTAPLRDATESRVSLTA